MGIKCNQNEAYFDELDEYIGCQVVVPGSDGVNGVLAKVRGRKRDSAGNLIGSPNHNPILDTRVYELEFPDGRVKPYATNVIAESLLSQVDEYDFDTGLLHEIISYRVDPNVAISRENGTTTTRTGTIRPVITTKGWELLVGWTDGSYSWMDLASLKESYILSMSLNLLMLLKLIMNLLLSGG